MSPVDTNRLLADTSVTMPETLSITDLARYAVELTTRARDAARSLALAAGARKNAWLGAAADALLAREAEILAANARDIEQAPAFGLSAAAIDRLRLNRDRLASIAGALREVALLPDPIGEAIDSSVRPNGLIVTRVRVPLGVVFFIYES